MALLVLKVISKDWKIQIWLMLYLETILHCSMKLPREGTNEVKRWVWLNSSKANFSRSEKFEKGQIGGILLLFNNFLKNCSITFFFICLQLHVFEDDFDQLSRDEFDLMTRQVMFKVRNVSFVPCSENSLYYLVVLKSCPKISMSLSHFQGQKVPI